MVFHFTTNTSIEKHFTRFIYIKVGNKLLQFYISNEMIISELPVLTTLIFVFVRNYPVKYCIIVFTFHITSNFETSIKQQ